MPTSTELLTDPVRLAVSPRRPGPSPDTQLAGQHFRILVSGQRPEFDAQTLAQPTHDAILRQ